MAGTSPSFQRFSSLISLRLEEVSPPPPPPVSFQTLLDFITDILSFPRISTDQHACDGRVL